RLAQCSSEAITGLRTDSYLSAFSAICEAPVIAVAAAHRLAGPSWLECGRVELAAGGDAELGVGLVQVVAHGARAQQQLGGDVAVGQPLRGEPGDLQLLRGEPGQAGPARPGGGGAGGGGLGG